jgi:hypothetical protein
MNEVAGGILEAVEYPVSAFFDETLNLEGKFLFKGAAGVSDNLKACILPQK